MRELVEMAISQHVICRNGDSRAIRGIHGISHWCRVAENAIRICAAEEENPKAGLVFGLFHDCCRVNDGRDLLHGPRAGEFIDKLPEGTFAFLSESDLELVTRACFEHTHKMHPIDHLVQCCVDADRLDLGRIGTDPDPFFLNTGSAKSGSIFTRGVEAGFHEIESVVMELLGINRRGEFTGVTADVDTVVREVLSR